MNAAQSGGHTGGGSMGKKGSQMEVIILNLKCTHIPHSYKNLYQITPPPFSHSFLKQKKRKEFPMRIFRFIFSELQIHLMRLKSSLHCSVCMYMCVCVYVCIRQCDVHRLNEPVLLFVIEFAVGRDVLRLPNDLQKN